MSSLPSPVFISERVLQGQEPPNRQMPFSHHPPEPALGHDLKEGMVVTGTIIRSHERGANIQLLHEPRIFGYSL